MRYPTEQRRIDMKKLIMTISTLISCHIFASTHLYETPSEQASIVQEVDPQHELSITTQDWVKVRDRETGNTGWAKLSELKKSLSNNAQWNYSMKSNNHTQKQRISYKPTSSENTSKGPSQVNASSEITLAHQRHKAMMRDFEKMWEELANDEEELS